MIMIMYDVCLLLRLHLFLAFSRLDPLQRLAMLMYAQVTPDVDLLSSGLRLPWYLLSSYSYHNLIINRLVL